jgi:hypothetical protein
LSEQAQRRLLTILAIVIAMGLTRPLNNFIEEQIPERRGIGDDAAEAILQGLARATAIFLASVVVRQIARARQ